MILSIITLSYSYIIITTAIFFYTRTYEEKKEVMGKDYLLVLTSPHKYKDIFLISFK